MFVELIFIAVNVVAFCVGWFIGHKLSNTPNTGNKVLKILGTTALWGILMWGCIQSGCGYGLKLMVLIAYAVSVIAIAIKK